MESLGNKEVKPTKPLRFLFKIEKPAPRPSTPSVPEINVSSIYLYNFFIIFHDKFCRKFETMVKWLLCIYND